MFRWTRIALDGNEQNSHKLLLAIPFGNPAILLSQQDRRLCVPASRRVCPFAVEHNARTAFAFQRCEVDIETVTRTIDGLRTSDASDRRHELIAMCEEPLARANARTLNEWLTTPLMPRATQDPSWQPRSDSSKGSQAVVPCRNANRIRLSSRSVAQSPRSNPR
jgi:hypothetical protein